MLQILEHLSNNEKCFPAWMLQKNVFYIYLGQKYSKSPHKNQAWHGWSGSYSIQYAWFVYSKKNLAQKPEVLKR